MTYDNHLEIQEAFDAAGNVLCLRNLGIHSEAVLCEDGFYSYEKEYDESGKLVSIRYYDTEGNSL